MKFPGKKNYPDHLTPVRFRGEQTSVIMTNTVFIHDIIWDDDDYPVQRDQISSFINNLNVAYKQVNYSTMKNLFVWPDCLLDDWAIDFNDSFILNFDAYYCMSSMQATIHISIYGITTVNWFEYQDTYQQAITMLKLSSDL